MFFLNTYDSTCFANMTELLGLLQVLDDGDLRLWRLEITVSQQIIDSTDGMVMLKFEIGGLVQDNSIFIANTLEICSLALSHQNYVLKRHEKKKDK